MLTFLFWNLAKRDIAQTVANLALENRVDFLLLAENEIPIATLLRALNPPERVRYNFAPSRLESRVDIFCAYAPNFVQPAVDTSRATVRKVQLPGRPEFLLCGVHFQSLLVWEEHDQALEAVELNRIIRDEENKAAHSRTIVVGDLNMNPYSLGITSANGFNAVMTREIVGQRDRRVAERDHPFFFNPMWRLFGDGHVHPSGTYFRNPSGYASVYWHMLDQVLVRPDLLHVFDISSLKIINEHSGGRLTNENGRPSVSDHLPILFKLNL